MPLTPGLRLGPYEITGAVGKGGMGEVYRARDTRLERDVAIKVLPPALVNDPQFRARFEREAKSVSALNHPHICTLHDVGEQVVGSESVHYLVMEMIEGESLADRIERGPLSLEEVLRWGAQIASGLDAAHRRGIVHRDLKPGNVMITKAGAKLVDFGLAKTGGSGAISGMSSLDTMEAKERPITEQGTVMGTFQYMSPEQLEGLPADARADIFALGALLYEMATGKKAFEGKNRTSLIAAIVSKQPPSISSVQGMSPPALDHVVRKCLEKDPDDRWQSAHDVKTQLEWIEEGGSKVGVPTVVAVKRRHPRRDRVGRRRRAGDYGRGLCGGLDAASANPAANRPIRDPDPRGPERRRNAGRVARRPRDRLRRRGRHRQAPDLDPAGRYRRGPAAARHRGRAASHLVARQPAHRLPGRGQVAQGAGGRRARPDHLRCAHRVGRHLERGRRDPVRRHRQRPDLEGGCRRRGGHARGADRFRQGRRVGGLAGVPARWPPLPVHVGPGLRRPDVDGAGARRGRRQAALQDQLAGVVLAARLPALRP